MATMRPKMKVKAKKNHDSDNQSAENCIDGPKIERKMNENDDGMPLEPITRVPVQMDHG